MRFTTKRPGTSSSSSVTSSPRRRSRPPHRAQASSPGAISTSMRGTWSGIGRRFGRRASSSSSSSGRRRRPMIAPAATSLVSSARCSCSALSPEAPWRCVRAPATDAGASRSGWPAPSPRRSGAAPAPSDHRGPRAAGRPRRAWPTMARRGVGGDPQPAGRTTLSRLQRPPWAGRGPPVQTLEQHRRPRRGQRHLALARRGPREAAALQPLGERAFVRHWSEDNGERTSPGRRTRSS